MCWRIQSDIIAAVKRDLNLWRLLLLEMRDGIKSPELENYDEATITYNSALLVKGGYVDGDVVENGSGISVGVAMLQMTNEGHDLLEKLEAEMRAVKPELPMAPKTKKQLSVFISHSSKDEKLALALVTLLRSALNIPAEQIRCTSINGYRLPIGTDTEERLRDEVLDAKAFIGLITPSSIASAYVMFELGARWGAKLHLAPLLGAGAGVECLQGPLSSLNALGCKDVAQVHQLISDLGDLLDIQESQRTKPAVYQNLIDGLVNLSTSEGSVENQPSPIEAYHKTNPWTQGLSTVLEPEQIVNLDEEETKILQIFERDNAYGYSKEIIAERFKIHPLKAGQILERLSKREFLYRVTRIGLGDSYRLATKGRDYLIANNLLS